MTETNFEIGCDFILSELFSLKHKLVDSFDDAEWIKPFQSVAKDIRECNRPLGDTEKEPYATAECLVRELIFQIIAKASEFYYRSITEELSKDFDSLLNYLPKYTPDTLVDFNNRYKRYYLVDRMKHFKDGLGDLDVYFLEKNRDWKNRVEKIIEAYLDDIYLNYPKHIVDDKLVDADRKKMLNNLREEIKYFDSKIWLEIYTELKTDEKIIRKLIHARKGHESALMRMVKNDNFLEQPTSLEYITYAIADYAGSWGCGDYYELYEYKYALDYCKYKAGYLDIKDVYGDEESESKDDTASPGSQVTSMIKLRKKAIIEQLEPFFEEKYKSSVPQFLEDITGKTTKTVESKINSYIKNDHISKEFVLKHLWKVLYDNDLYKPGYTNFQNHIRLL